MQTFIIIIGVVVILLFILILWMRKPLNYHNMGITKFNSGDFEGAIKDFNKAIQINPLNANPYLYRGYSKVNLGDVHGAIDDYSQALTRQKPTADLYLNRGALKHQLEDYDGAIEDYNNAIKLSPKDGDLFYNRSLSKQSIDDTEGALLDLNQANMLGCKKADELLNKLNNESLNFTDINDKEQLKQIEAAIKILSNLYLHTISNSVDVFDFRYPDSRFRFIIFCLSAMTKSCEDVMNSSESLQKECLHFLSNFATSKENIDEFFSEQVNSQQAEKIGAVYLKEFMDNWIIYFDAVKSNDKAKASDIICSMVYSTETNKPIVNSDKERLKQPCREIEFSLTHGTMKDAFIELVAK